MVQPPKKPASIPRCLRLSFGVIALLHCMQVVYFFRHSDFKEVSISSDSPLNLNIFNSARRARGGRVRRDSDRQAHFLIHQTNITGLEMRPHYLGYRPTKKTKDDVSVVTQCDINKFDRLLHLASRWSGCVSVAVYIEGPHHEAALEKLTDLYTQHAALLEAKVSFHLVINRGGKEVLEHYPHNILRNMAMDHASTDFAFVLDVDFTPSEDAHAQVLSHLQSFDLRAQKQALVVPAFEQLRRKGEPNNITAANFPPNKDALKREMQAKPTLYQPFLANYFPAYGPTNYEKWYNTTRAYTIPYEVQFEPYVVVFLNPDRLPRFWEHFTGFGRNKLSWIEEMAVAGYTFHVVPDSFVMHIYHGGRVRRTGRRVTRPFVLNEYAHRFQPYLNRTYGRSYWTDEELEEWLSWKLEKFNDWKDSLA